MKTITTPVVKTKTTATKVATAKAKPAAKATAPVVKAAATVVKPTASVVNAPVAPVVKPTAKAVPKTMFWYAELLARAMKGEFGPLVSRYYVSAVKHHAKLKTAFPRARNAGEPLMKASDAIMWIEAHRLTSIPPGVKVGQRLFDEMMVQAKSMPKPAAKAA